MYNFEEKYFIEKEGKLVFNPNISLADYDILQLILEAERNIGALSRLGLKNHPLRPTILRNSMIRTAHFTTKIENNKLVYKEVEQLYENYQKKTLSLKEKSKIEISNVFGTYDYIYKLAPRIDFSNMNEQILIDINSMLMEGLTGHPTGYRSMAVSLTDGDGNVSYSPPPFNEVPKYMTAFFEWLFTAVTGYANPYEDKSDKTQIIHPLLLSAITHHFIGYIHPFPDGNGRTARAFSTLVGLLHKDLSTIKDTFCIEEFIEKSIEDYYDTLLIATQGELKPFALFYLECVNNSLSKVLAELQRHNKIKHVRELLGVGNARTMFEMIVPLGEGELFQRSLFDSSFNVSTDSITKNLKKLRELGVVKQTEKRGEYIITINT